MNTARTPSPPERGLILTKAALLFGLAAYFAINILTGNLSNYINTKFAWLSYVAVVLFAALGAAELIQLRGGGTMRESSTVETSPSPTDESLRSDWVSRFADEVIAEVDRRIAAGQARPEAPVVCASGVSPSGPIHLGNLREV